MKLWALLALLAAAPAQGAVLPRLVLALYNARDIPGDLKDWALTTLHQRAEMPLNYLGLQLVYHNMADPLPPATRLGDYAGVITWFNDPQRSVPDPDAYCRWLEDVASAGLKIVILDEPGVLRPAKSGQLRMSAACRAAFRGLGYEFDAVVVPSPLSWDVVAKDPGMVEFERKLSLREAEQLIVMRSRASKSYLKIKIHELGGVESDQVVVNGSGGMALRSFAIYDRPAPKARMGAKGRASRWNDAQAAGLERQFRWRIDPFAFFGQAFGVNGRPRPDPTTLNGRRVFFSQIDGDGFFNVSELDHRSFSAEVFLKEIIARHPDVPFTASLITGYYELKRYQDDEVLDLSRRILGMANVEPASHSHAHPLVWQRGALSLDLPGYAYDPRTEILGSSDFVRRLLEPGKKPALYLWSGDALPGPDALSLVESAGLAHMNGGGTRLDDRYASYGFASALGRLVGRFKQIYAPQSDENNFTALWRGPYYGYRDVVETLRRTDAPRRVKPIDVYVHYYSAEKLAALNALKDVLAWVESQKTIPIFASEYVGMARAFYEMRVERREDGSFLLEGGKALRTVRFDDEDRAPDLARSRNVIGFKREGSRLYVSLSEEEPRLLALTREPPSLPYLSESNFQVSGWRSTPARVRFMKKGWSRGEMIIAGLQEGTRYRVACAGWERVLRPGSGRFLEIQFPDAERAGPAREVVLERLP